MKKYLFLATVVALGMAGQSLFASYSDVMPNTLDTVIENGCNPQLNPNC